MKTNILTFLAVLFLAACSGTTENPEITENEIFQHLSYLASDSLKGRLPGTAEDKLAALYIASEFKKAGLSFLTEDGLQPFDIITDLEIGEENYLRLGTEEYDPQLDFVPFPFTANKSLESEVVFTGYGIDFQREGITWNDYEGIDVEGKWVIVLKGNPEIDSTSSVFNEFSNERDKAMVASDHGAGGILFVSGPQFSPDDQLVDLDKREGKVSIPALNISRKVADRLLKDSGNTIESVEKQLNKERKSSSFSTGVSLAGSAEVNPSHTTTYNVVAYFEGSDPERKNEYIIMGAHYDHLGMGGPGSSSRRPDTLDYHNGADDNASGVAALIEIAEKIAGADKKPANSYIFIAFGAEEMGLLGSKYYADNPLLPRDKTRIMLNMDMIGRLRDYQLQVGGVGTAEESKNIVTELGEKSELKISTTREGYGASDHSSFYAKNIPVLFLTTGAHTDYHTPEDDVEYINIEGMVLISNYIIEIANYIDSTNIPLVFQEAGPKFRYSGRRGRRIALGIMPDFTDNDENPGMRVDNVNPGQPADLGGMKKGDYILAIEGKAINGIYDYMYRLNNLSKGQIIVVTVKRENQTLDLLVQL
ncbi:M20/M25/M40 family metallo-hydrolase [Bacteroidota bacterium]